MEKRRSRVACCERLDLSGRGGAQRDWQGFLADFREEHNEAHRYAIRTLTGYLTPSSGGTRTGGGGGDNELKRVWPFVARVMSRR